MRENKKCNQCNSVKHYSLFRKKNNKSGWKDINGGLRYSYCKPCEADRMRERYIKNPIPQMLSNSKIRARKKGIPHTINTNDIKKIWPKDNRCPILKKEFVMGYKKDKSYAPSLDRVEPKLGYVKGNIMIISDIANRMKQDTSLADLERFAHYYLKNKEANIFKNNALGKTKI